MKTFNKMKFITLLLIVLMQFIFISPSKTLAATDPGLGAATSFSVLGNTAVTNVPTSVIGGDVGLNAAGSNYSGLTSLEVAGTIYDANGTGPDGAAAILPPAVQSDAVTANGNMLSQGSTGTIGPALDSLVLTPGVYDIGAGRLNGGVLTLDGPGVYIFRASSDFVSSGSVNLINGARACDVFWSVNSLATINGSSFVGTIIAGTGVHFGANVTLDGRALAIGGDVTMIMDTISGPTCATAASATTPTPAGDGLSDGRSDSLGSTSTTTTSTTSVLGASTNTLAATGSNDQFLRSMIAITVALLVLLLGQAHLRRNETSKTQ